MLKLGFKKAVMKNKNFTDKIFNRNRSERDTTFTYFRRNKEP